MRITAEYLRRIWGDFQYFSGGYIKLDVEYPLECYLGYQDIDHKVLVLVSTQEPRKLPSSKSILSEKRIRQDNRWTTSLKLMKNAQEGVFETLCADILSYSSQRQEESFVLKLIEQRYHQWNLLLQSQKKSLMDESSRKGLLGELLFLAERLAEDFPALQTITGWVGPDGADQDFSYAEAWYEIKAVGIAAESIIISSLEQLSRTDRGQIVVMRVDKCAPERPGALSLVDAVQRVRFLLQDTEALTLFDNKLLRYGYIDLDEYKEQKYIYSSQERYVVDENFPRLTAEILPAQVTSAHYTLSLSGIDNWKVEG